MKRREAKRQRGGKGKREGRDKGGKGREMEENGMRRKRIEPFRVRTEKYKFPRRYSSLYHASTTMIDEDR